MKARFYKRDPDDRNRHIFGFFHDAEGVRYLIPERPSPTSFMMSVGQATSLTVSQTARTFEAKEKVNGMVNYYEV